MNNKIPKELAERQKQQRQNTANTVRKAIEDLSSEGHKITIKLLMEYTGLSRSVFGKEHVKDVLTANGIGNENDCNHKSKRKDSYEEQLKDVINNYNISMKKDEIRLRMYDSERAICDYIIIKNKIDALEKYDI